MKENNNSFTGRGISKKSINKMLIIMLALVIVAPVILIISLANIQFVKNADYQQRAITQQLRETVVTPNRGTIYDTNMKPLASSASVWTIVLNPKAVKDEEQRNLVSDGMAEILDIDRDTVYEKAGKNRYYEVLKKKVDHDTYEAVTQFITENKLSCLYSIDDSKRYYPYGAFASSILGFTGTDNNGLSGLESYYESQLAGTPGWILQAKDATGREMEFGYETSYEAKKGANLVLTIDEVIQHYLEKHIDLAATENNVTNRVTGIVMDVDTCAILGMATTGEFDPNSPFEVVDPGLVRKLSELEEDEEKYKKTKLQYLQTSWQNKAVSDTYEPGSVFKSFTAAMALEEKVVKQDDMFTCTGSYKPIASMKSGISCHRHAGHGTISFRTGLQQSCNPCFMKVGERIGADLFYKYFGAFGFREHTGIDLPGEANSVYHSLETLQNPISLATDSFGQTFRVTPIQIITAMSCIANGGKLCTPHVVDKMVDDDGNIISSSDTTVRRQVISQATSEEMRELLKSVVDVGGAKNAYIPGYRVAGKTGTSEKRDIYDENGNQITDLRIASFCGFAPADDPKVAVLIVLDEPHASNISGGTIASPVAKAVLEDVLPYLGVEPIFTEKELKDLDISTPNVTGESVDEAQTRVKGRGLKVKIMGNGTKVLSQVPMSGEAISKEGTVVLFTDIISGQELVTVPNLIGMTVSEVNSVLINAGLNVKFTGSDLSSGGATCYRQSIPVGDQVSPGTIITADFRYSTSDDA
ncbi:MAG: PASTA domain-containing protein [Clostridia bacterium]|nr:PASTA domain-containing protein [Clostridia bacterium]